MESYPNLGYDDILSDFSDAQSGCVNIGMLRQLKRRKLINENQRNTMNARNRWVSYSTHFKGFELRRIAKYDYDYELCIFITQRPPITAKTVGICLCKETNRHWMPIGRWQQTSITNTEFIVRWTETEFARWWEGADLYITGHYRFSPLAVGRCLGRLPRREEAVDKRSDNLLEAL